MKNLKIYKAFPAYQNYLEKFYDSNIGLKKMDFFDLRNALIKDSFPWIFSWSTNIFNDDINIFETVHNCEWLQKSWDVDRKIYDNWQIEIVMEQIKTFKPNICVLYPPELFTHEIISQIKDIVNHEMVIFGYDGMNRMNVDLYKGYDLIITCSDYISDFYKINGKLSYPLEFGFDESVLRKIDLNSLPVYNVGFSGTIYSGLYPTRYNTLKYLTKKTRIDIRSDFNLNNNHNLFSKRQIKLFLKNMDIAENLALNRIGNMNLGPVYGLDMYQFLRKSKISLNIHGEEIDFAGNVRLYEITGIGSCMLAEWKKNIENIFIPDKEIVVYKSLEEAYDKIKFLTKNENIRKKIALGGQEKTLKNYTYKRRFSDFIIYLKEYFLN